MRCFKQMIIKQISTTKWGVMKTNRKDINYAR